MSGKSNNVNRRRSTNSSAKINPVKRYDYYFITNNRGPIQKGKKKKIKGERKKHPVLKRVILISIAVIFLAILIMGGIFAGIFFSDKFALTKDDLLIGEANTIIYDSEGTLDLFDREATRVYSILDKLAKKNGWYIEPYSCACDFTFGEL